VKRTEFLDLLKERVLFLDGAYGTELFKRAKKRKAIELLNIENPEVVRKLQDEYIKAGADILLTNTFSANRIKLRSLGCEELLEKINSLAVKVAKSVCSGDQLLFGDISSTGIFVEPFGEMEFDRAHEVFKEQAKILIENGVDGIIIETMSDLKELKAAILAVRDLTSNLPIIAHMTFEENGISVTGTSVEIFANLMNDLDVDVVGINCSLEPGQMLSVFSKLSSCCKKPLCVEPNAGNPILDKNGELSYKTTPEEFAVYMADFVELGANIVGGCCGTTPEHIKMMRDYIGIRKPVKRKIQTEQFLSSRTVLKPVEPFLVIGERINASGRKKLQEQIRNKDFSGVISLAQQQEKEGSSAIDVNLGIEKLLETDHFKRVVLELDKRSSLPVSFDVQTLEFLETCMKEYPGRALINSAFSRQDHLIERLKLLKRYGGMLIVLTMEKDIPVSAEERFAVFQKAVKIIEEFGIDPQRIYFDPLVLPIGAKNDYHTTIQTIRMIAEEGFKTSIGLSNLSFGMPKREALNAAFLSLCVEAGLKAAILNSKEITTTNTLHGALMLRGEELTKEKNVTEDPLISAITSGRQDEVMRITKEYLKEHSPLHISQNILTKAMEEVGKLYSTGKIYLPHLILAADTVQPIFEYLNSLIDSAPAKLGKVLLATVQGDVHDIGKKIVATVLRSGGFEVHDIGKDVPAEKIFQEVQKLKPDIVGLSAMMTTTVGQVKLIADMLKSHGIRVMIIAGGASMNNQLAKSFDVHYAKNAHQALELCKKIMAEIGGDER